MANVRLAMVYEDGEVFVELKPELIIQLLNDMELDGEKIYNKLVETLNMEFRRK